MKRLYSILLVLIPLLGFATAGFAERRFSYEKWLAPAGYYCIIFGLISFALLTLISLIWKRSLKNAFKKFSDFLLKHSTTLGVIFSGLLLSIVFGLLLTGFEYILWILSIFPGIVMIFGMPIIISFKSIRNKWLLNPCFLKWSAIFSLSAIIASLKFMICAKNGIIPGLDIWVNPFGRNKFYSHPYDSLFYIWTPVFAFLNFIWLSLAFVWIGTGVRKLRLYFKLRFSRKEG